MTRKRKNDFFPYPPSKRRAKGSTVQEEPVGQVSKFTPASVRERTWGEFGGQLAGQAVGAAVGSVVGQSYLGGQIGFDLASPNLNIPALRETKSLMGGKYTGKLTAQRGRGTISVRNQYQKNGAIAIMETFGLVTDSDMVAVGHITFQLEVVVRAITYCLLRKLFRKAGLIVENTSQEINIIDFTDSGVVTLHWSMMDTDGTITSASYGFGDNVTLDIVYASSGIKEVIENMIKDANPKKLQKVGLSCPAGLTSQALISVLYMKQEKLEVTVNAHTVIQNRTLGAAASDSSLAVNAQPLKGPIFEFSGIPKTKQVNAVVLNVTQTAAGVILFRRNQLGSGDLNAWAEPPVKKAFNNCTKSGYVRVAPGELRDMEASKTWTGYFENILCGRFRYAAENAFVSHAPGMSQVVYLEEELNSGSANKIQVAYETQHTCGVSLTTSNAANMQPYYAATEYNNF